MPEGHTVRRLTDRFVEEMGRRRVSASSPQGRFSGGAALLDGRVLAGGDAHGKQMFLDFGDDLWLRVHLGLYGKWTFGTGAPPEPRGALRLRLETEPDAADGDRPAGAPVWADLRGPTACEVVTAAEKDVVHARLGADPLRRDADLAGLVARVGRSRAPIGTILMDQALVAGVGNVYRAEALFRAGLSPFREGRSLTADDVAALWGDLRAMLRDGVRRGRIVTTSSVDRPRGRIRLEDAHYVYRRTGLPCRHCGTPIATKPVAGRNLFWCPGCQA